MNDVKSESARSWLWIAALVLAALTLGMSFAHVLELPAKMSYGPDLWTRLSHTLYGSFAGVGGPIEVVNVLLLVRLAYAVRGRRGVRSYAVVAAGCFLLALLVWAVVVQPVNAHVAHWSIGSVPSGWQAWRSRWEYGHTARFALMLVGYGVLVRAVVGRHQLPIARTTGLHGEPERQVAGLPAARVAAADLAALVRPIRAVGLTALAFGIYPAITIARGTGTLGHTLPPTLITLAAVTVYLWLAWTFTGSGAGWARWSATGLLVALGVAAPAVYGQAWLGLLIYSSIGVVWVIPGVPALGAVAALTVTTAVVGVGIDASAGLVLAVTVVTALSGFGAWGIVRLALANAALRSSQAEVARLAATDERLRLAAELHDRVKQQVFIATMETGAARVIVDSDPVRAAGHLSDADRALRQAQGDLAGLITGLQKAAEPRQGLADALPALVADWSVRTGTPADLQCAGLPALSEDIGQLLLVAATEALTNVTRHAAATHVTINVTTSSEQITLTVTDDGRGIQPVGLTEGARTGHGLSLLAERALQVGGHLETGNAPEGGTTLTVRYPTYPGSWVGE